MRRFHMVLGADVPTPPPTGVVLPGVIASADTTSAPTPASASVTFDPGGTYATDAGSDDWYLPPTPAIGALYEIRFSPSSGSVSSGSVNTWVSMSVPVTWTRNQAVAGFSEVSGTLEIRLASTAVVQATCTLSLTAEQL